MNKFDNIRFDEARLLIKQWQNEGLKVGFTNGCFDLLHPGHTTYLDSAKNNCDKLVVGLNSDESIKMLKGPTRPVQDEVSRGIVLTALRSVDLVVIFNQKRADEILENLVPDIYFKGGDKTRETVEEIPTIDKLGIEFQTLDLVENQSTTSLIEKSK